MPNPVNAILVVIVTIFSKRSPFPPRLCPQNPESESLSLTSSSPVVPPVGVFLIAGCGADLLINICLTCLG